MRATLRNDVLRNSFHALMFSCLQNFPILQNGFDIVKNRIGSLLSRAPSFCWGCREWFSLAYSLAFPASIRFRKAWELQTIHHFITPPWSICGINFELLLVCWIMLTLIPLFTSNYVYSLRQKVWVPLLLTSEQLVTQRHADESPLR